MVLAISAGVIWFNYRAISVNSCWHFLFAGKLSVISRSIYWKHSYFKIRLRPALLALSELLFVPKTLIGLLIYLSSVVSVVHRKLRAESTFAKLICKLMRGSCGNHRKTDKFRPIPKGKFNIEAWSGKLYKYCRRSHRLGSNKVGANPGGPTYSLLDASCTLTPTSCSCTSIMSKPHVIRAPGRLEFYGNVFFVLQAGIFWEYWKYRSV